MFKGAILNILRGSFLCNKFSCGIDETMITNSNMWNIYVISIQYVIFVGLICEDQVNSSGCGLGDTRRELINCEYCRYRSHSSSNVLEHWLGFPDEISQCYSLPRRIVDSIFSVSILSRIFSKLLNSCNDEPGGLYQVLIRKGLILGFLISTHKNSSASFDKSSPLIINSMAPDTNPWSTHDPQQSS